MVREVARVQHKHKSDELKFSFKRKRAKNSLQLYVDCGLWIACAIASMYQK